MSRDLRRPDIMAVAALALAALGGEIDPPRGPGRRSYLKAAEPPPERPPAEKYDVKRGRLPKGAVGRFQRRIGRGS